MVRNKGSNSAFSATREPGGLRVSLPVKSERFRTLLNLVWLLAWAAGEVAMVLFLWGPWSSRESAPSVPLPMANVFLAVFSIGGGFVLWRWLWGMGGRETFLVSRHSLSARREIWGIGRSRIFDLEDIRSVRAGRLKYRVIYPSWGRMFIGHDESEIVIDSSGRTYAYGKRLEESEARDLADLLLEEMSFHYHNQLVSKARSAIVM